MYAQIYMSIYVLFIFSFSGLLPARTIDKIDILGYDSLPELEEYLSPDNIPSNLSLSVCRTNYYFLLSNYLEMISGPYEYGLGQEYFTFGLNYFEP